MKDYALSLLEEVSDITSRRNILREYLQAYILRILHERNCFENIAFIGGTALRLLHGLPRFSEDLDFSLVSSELFNFEKLLKGLKSDLTGSGYSVDISFKSNKAVNSAFIKFQTLLFEAEISPMKSQNMSIKIEIDSNPPEGALQETRVLLVYYPIELRTFDISSLFAGKCHAMLSRRYTKGRDFFDLAWYLTKYHNLTPNLLFLTNALLQTNWDGALPTEENWKLLILKVVEEADWNLVASDTRNFLEREKDLGIFNQQNIVSLLKK